MPCMGFGMGHADGSCVLYACMQIGGTHSTRPGPDDLKTLKQLNFQVGQSFLLRVVSQRPPGIGWRDVGTI